MVTKIIVVRLRPLLDKLVSTVQTTFIPHRKKVDNAIIVQEIIHTISRKKENVGYMAIKVDLENAYDKLEWSFIHETLQKANIHQDLVQLIMSYVSTTSTSILFNGGKLEPFFPSYEIRQRDSPSSYIFILCMEVLGQLIKEKHNDNLWIPVKDLRSGLAFSHLFFMNDLVLLMKADDTNCAVIRDVLDDFYAKLGQTVSDSKSRVSFSPNVDRDTRESLCDILGFQYIPNLRKYLEFPINHRGAYKQDFNFVLDRVKQKLAEWKASLLSFADSCPCPSLFLNDSDICDAMQCFAEQNSR